MPDPTNDPSWERWEGATATGAEPVRGVRPPSQRPASLPPPAPRPATAVSAPPASWPAGEAAGAIGAPDPYVPPMSPWGHGAAPPTARPPRRRGNRALGVVAVCVSCVFTTSFVVKTVRRSIADSSPAVTLPAPVPAESSPTTAAAPGDAALPATTGVTVASGHEVVVPDAVRFVLPGAPVATSRLVDTLAGPAAQRQWTFDAGDVSLVVELDTFRDDATFGAESGFDAVVGGMQRDVAGVTTRNEPYVDAHGLPGRRAVVESDSGVYHLDLRVHGRYLLMVVARTSDAGAPAPGFDDLVASVQFA